MYDGIRGRTSYVLFATSLGGFILWLIARLAQRAFRNSKLPPGPRGLPLIGDVRHMSDSKWLASPQRKDDYGEMMYISALGEGFLVLNSLRVAIDLLDKRSNIYSSRPRYVSANEYLTEGLTMVLSPYCDIVRRFRRVAAEGFSKSAVQNFHPTQNREAIILTLSLMKNPVQKKFFQRHAASIMFSVNYHFPPLESEDDPLIVGVANFLQRLQHEMRPGARLVEYFHWLTYVPSRFAKWKRDAQYWFIQDTLMFQRLLDNVAEDLANGIDRPCFGATVIRAQSKYHLTEREQAWLAGDMVTAGVDTKSSTLLWWLLAMLVYPEVQARAHAEIDEVVGRARPPTFADVPSLPYIRAMVKETLRWSPIFPFGVPHASTADDWYEGMFIPKGTICLQNMRVLNSDPKVYGSNAAEFDPARYLDEKGQVKTVLESREDGHVTFGFGRRVCPGRHITEGTLVIDFAMLLWAMRFECPEGSQGELDASNYDLAGVTACPMPFECKAVPRYMEAEALLEEALSLYG
ncbi:cytochrome P450 [Lactarius quietus]|nr:cytochrome P450 [Lactarius quietus]